MTAAALSLAPFPGRDAPAIAIQMRADRRGPAGLCLDLTITGDVGAVRLPAWVQRSRADELWRTTCFEAFIWAGEGAYFEINLSPSGQWSLYRFEGYRSGRTALDGVEVRDSRLDVSGDQIAFTATLDLDRLPLPPRPWRVGLSTVIETTDGAISYWALAHPSDKPDFHHPYSFLLELP